MENDPGDHCSKICHDNQLHMVTHNPYVLEMILEHEAWRKAT